MRTLLTIVLCMAMAMSCSGKDPPYTECGEASYYADRFHGRKTASGERYDKNEFTAAHRTLPFGTYVRVWSDGGNTIVRINDRGPHIEGRIIDLSRAAAEEIGLVTVGVTKVCIEVVKQ